MPVNDRKQVLNRLAAATEPYLVTNARCLTEGIDVPALDAVAFADPRKSQVDIVQAVGRAMRRPMGTSKKTTGYIILPVYLTKKELKDPETAVEGSAFEPVLQVLRALKDHDPFMARFMAKILVAKGKKPHQKAGGIGEILEVSIGDELDKVLAKRILESVQLRALTIGAGSFAIGLELLKKFKEDHGHLDIPSDFHNLGFALGRWVSNVRSGIVKSSSERRAQLDSIGFIWNAIDWRWEQNFRLLKQYKEREGSANVPDSWREQGVDLATWSSNQRTKRLALSLSQIQRLDSVGFSWDPRADAWQKSMVYLRKFVRRNGHARVPYDWKESEFSLGHWVATVRSAGKKGLLASRLKDLKELGFVWDGRDALFESNLRLLDAFRRREGHTRVPARHVEAGVRLGSWVSVLRLKKKQLPRSKIKLLDQHEFNWNPIDEQFQAYLLAFSRYVAREGHAEVPQSWIEDHLRLGSWMSTLRQGKKKLDPEELRRVNALGFVWDVKANSKLRFMAALKKYSAREKHCRVPQTWVEDGLSLGRWISSIRSGKVRLSRDELRQLKELGFIANARDEYRQRCLAAARQYSKREGNLDVPSLWMEGDIALGRWIQSLRQGKVNLAPGDTEKLKKLGFRTRGRLGPRK
jgi:hypothetical protein